MEISSVRKTIQSEHNHFKNFSFPMYIKALSTTEDRMRICHSTQYYCREIVFFNLISEDYAVRTCNGWIEGCKNFLLLPLLWGLWSVCGKLITNTISIKINMSSFICMNKNTDCVCVWLCSAFFVAKPFMICWKSCFGSCRSMERIIKLFNLSGNTAWW